MVWFAMGLHPWLLRCRHYVAVVVFVLIDYVDLRFVAYIWHFGRLSDLIYQ